MGEARHLAVVRDSTRAQLKAVKRRFQALNGERLARVREQLKPEQRVFVDVLPLLFHTNNPSLPGFVSKKTPAGIADYSPSRRTTEAAAKLVRKFAYRRKALRVYNIHALYMIGSTGTIAYSEKSDFDVWVCHRPDLPDSQVESLREKCRAIEKWARSLDLDAKFFVMEAGAVRRGETEALSEDSSGSAQQHLLIEEFYRTGLLLAGRYPAWWLVPPDHESEYDQFLHELVEKRYVEEHELVDFGPIAEIPAEEFFGAALWQLHKAIDSPYKSVLKLLLMESYAAEYPCADLLCTRFKRAVYEGLSDVDELDPYILMTKKVEDYLRSRGEHTRLDLARKCLYFKVAERLSERAPRAPSHRREAMEAQVDGWGWTRDDLLILDSRPKWKIHRVMDERRALVDELTRSYRIVSEFARAHAGVARINKADLNLLGRRLYAAFERKAGKVEIINPGISTDLTEQRLSFVQSSDDNRDIWLLYRGEYQPEAPRKVQPIKRAQSLIELVAWCHFNRLISPETLINLHSNESVLSARELLAVVDSFRRLFPEGTLPESGIEHLRQPARVVSSALYINLGVDPLISHTRRGIHLTSNRSDALSYGGFWKNLALTFDLVLVTSWREVLTFHYSGQSAVLDCLGDYMAWTSLSSGEAPPPVQVHSFSSTRGMAIAHRIAELFRDTSRVFYETEGGAVTRYVLRIEHDFYLLQPENEIPRARRVGDEAALIQALGEPQAAFSPIAFDHHAVEGSALAAIAAVNKAATVQLFYAVNADKAQVYVLDEHGSLFYQTAPLYNETCLMAQYQRFIESVIQRCNFSEDSTEEGQINPQIEVYKIGRARGGRPAMERQKPARSALNADYLSIQVIGEPADNDGTIFSLYCEGEEFSSLEYGQDVFSEVARYVISRRQSGKAYPIYITDVDVGRALLGADSAFKLQTVHYLNYKKRIEARINATLAGL